MADKGGYIGRNPGDSSVTIARQTFTPTSETESFTFTSGYTVGLVDVYLNGAKLVDARDYDANTGSTVGLTSAAQSGDIVEIIAYKAFNLSQVNSTSGNFDVGSNLSVGSTTTLSGVTTCEGDLYVGGNLYTLGDVTYDEVSGRNLNITGIATAATIHVGSATTIDGSGINVTGVITGTSFSGDGSALTGIAATNNINTNNIKVSGITTLTGYVSTGSTVGAAGSIYFPDNKGVNFGGNPEGDLQIYHDAGAHNYVSAVTGDLLLRSNYIKLQTPTGENCIETKLNGEVDIFWDNTKKFNTDSAGTYTTGIHTASQSLHAGTTVQLDGGTGVVTATTFKGNVTAGTGATIFSPASNVLTVGTANTEVVRINAAAGVLLNNGILVERVKIDSDSINSDKFLRLQDGMVHYRSSAVGAASVKPDIVSNTGINTDLAIGDTIAVTLITVAGSTSHFVSSVAIDGKHTGITTHWVGGSTPTAGGGSGVDTYTFNILKTASETYTVIANQVLTSS